MSRQPLLTAAVVDTSVEFSLNDDGGLVLVVRTHHAMADIEGEVALSPELTAVLAAAISRAHAVLDKCPPSDHHPDYRQEWA